MLRLIAVVIAASFCAGCATNTRSWVKPGATDSDYAVAEKQCNFEAQGASTSPTQVSTIFNSCMQGMGWKLRTTGK